MNAPVAVRNLAKTFYDEGRGEIKAVDSINFECQEAEIFGLLGANGAGKTTTLRMLSTILAPTSGTATIMGHDVVTNPEGVRKNLGFYSATTALYPRLTTRETIEFFARINQYAADLVEQRSEEHTSELQSRSDLVCRLLLEKKKNTKIYLKHYCA